MSFLKKLMRSTEEADADELQESVAQDTSCRSIGTLADRSHVTVLGVIKSVTLPPKATVPALVAEVFDGSGRLYLVWLGRREIIGIRPGVHIKATGRITYRKGTPTIFNPSYELVPARAG